MTGWLIEYAKVMINDDDDDVAATDDIDYRSNGNNLFKFYNLIKSEISQTKCDWIYKPQIFVGLVTFGFN